MGAGGQSLSEPDADLLAARYRRTRARTVALAAPLGEGDATAQSMPDASPAKWHLAHTSWFFETFVVAPWQADYRSPDPRFGFLFNSYYDAVGERLARERRGLLTRPTLAEVLDYRHQVDAALLALLPDLPPEARDRITLGCEHEAQHQELLLTDLLHLFSLNPLEPAYATEVAPGKPAEMPAGWLAGPAGPVAVGHGGDNFAFDCEGPRHIVTLSPHALATRLVTNAEWQAFVADGGYRRPELWLADGWQWCVRERVEAPFYWRGDDAFGLHGRQPRDPHAPVAHVSHFEADAYARWADARLPTEFEWEASACNPELGDAFGARWQWTASAFLPYPRYRSAAGALGEYNGKFMSGQLVLRGSSHATAPDTWRATARNFFPPIARWQFTGVRLARDL